MPGAENLIKNLKAKNIPIAVNIYNCIFFKKKKKKKKEGKKLFNYIIIWYIYMYIIYLFLFLLILYIYICYYILINL